MNAERVSELLAAHGVECRDARRVTTGKFNDTFVCEVAPGAGAVDGAGRVVVRVAPPDDAGFLFYERGMMAQEPGLHRLLREKTSVPVPRVYIYDSTRVAVDRDFLVMEYINGVALSDAGVSAGVRADVARQVGSFLREVHEKCRSESYGYLGEHRCMEPQRNWVSAFAVMWDKLIADIEACGVYAAADAALARDTWELRRAAFERPVVSSLLHMDIWDQNVLIGGDGRVAALVDWDRALWGDPEIEFAVLDYCGYNTPSFWQGYGSRPEQTPRSAVRAAFYHLYETQKYLVIWTLRSGEGPVESYRRYALDMLRRLRAERL
ncbi:MAG: phosphotransferase [Chitinivibrionales bacterium]|nr:phosphotransferase [Chitinivibrionales bacterium]